VGISLHESKHQLKTSSGNSGWQTPPIPTLTPRWILGWPRWRAAGRHYPRDRALVRCRQGWRGRAESGTDVPTPAAEDWGGGGDTGSPGHLRQDHTSAMLECELTGCREPVPENESGRVTPDTRLSVGERRVPVVATVGQAGGEDKHIWWEPVSIRGAN